MNKKWFCIVVCAIVLAWPLAGQQPETLLLRFPACHGDQVVFTYGGDLYAVASAGGVARKLTSHEGNEMFARLSPDGRHLAFTAQYDGNTEVYVMPAAGGVPRRLTFTATLGRDEVSDRMGPNNIVMGWSPDSKRVVFRSRMKEFNDFIGQLFTVSLDGDLPEQLPLPRGGFCSFSPDGGKLAYNRVFREFRTWKRYRGGMADDIWIHDFASKKTTRISDDPACDIIPMWRGDRIYFISDRGEGKRFNLYCFDLKTRQTRRLTDFVDYDIKFPSLGDRAIVFENGGALYRFDLAAEKSERIPVQILDDLARGRGGIVAVDKAVTNYEISPDGKRALFGARGDVFTVPVKHGDGRNLTATPGVHERNGKWSPDGRWIAFISDASGEDEICLLPQDGRGSPRQLTRGADTYKYKLFWSPDGRKILWADKKLRLQYVDVESRAVTLVATAQAFEFTQYAWSPDSRWIAYAKPEEEVQNRIYLYSLEKKSTAAVTDGWYTSAAPAFSSDGKFLFFVSNRDFHPGYSAVEYDYFYRDMSRVYLVTLARDTASPFKPKSDEVEPRMAAAAAGKKPAASEKPGSPAPTALEVDLEGIAERIAALPIEAANYRDVAAVGNSVYYIRRASTDPKPLLMLYDLAERKETNLGECDGYEVSADGKKMLVAREGSYAIVDLPKGKLDFSERLDLADLQVALDRKAEWKQIFHECWRQMRDFFYAPNMHGVDWPAARKKFEPLLESINSRADLTYVIGEMIGELSAGHAYVGGGDIARPRRIATGLLGAEVERDPSSKYYRVKRILRGQNWDPGRVSPLTQIGVNVAEGEYILAVNGRDVRRMGNLFEALVNTVGKQVCLRVNSRPAEAGSRETIVVPIADEGPLYYLNWVEANIVKVNAASGGKVGYIHVPNMGNEGLNEFVKYFYPQLRKKALIIDVRGNGGGSVSPLLIDRLRRQMAMAGMARNTSAVPDPFESVLGPMVCLLDEFSASDGDIFPFRFKKHNLGKLIGKRSWGGVVGIRGSLPLLDGGSLFKPEFATFGAYGEGWIIEGRGVDPDIEVDNDPAREFAGIDDQLDRAIAVILE
ncbi:MAG: PD40 domain-containing protein, partial [Candidatus Aminicenantes bacterium]|nr:PD40 domain-containing protein [Candidatus Aminicenantes bacterium]